VGCRRHAEGSKRFGKAEFQSHVQHHRLSAPHADRVFGVGDCDSRSATQTQRVWAGSSPQPAARSSQELRSSSAMSGWIHAWFLRWLNGEELQPALRADRVPEGRNCGSRSATQTLRVWADSSPQSAQGRRVEQVDIARALVGRQQEFCDVRVDPRTVRPLAEWRGGVARAARGPDSRGARLWLTIGYPNAARLGR
jgi:hypothetical protein